MKVQSNANLIHNEMTTVYTGFCRLPNTEFMYSALTFQHGYLIFKSAIMKRFD